MREDGSDHAERKKQQTLVKGPCGYQGEGASQEEPEKQTVKQVGENQESGLAQKSGEESVSQKRVIYFFSGGVTSSKKPPWAPHVGLGIPQFLSLPHQSAYLSPRLAWEYHEGRDKV